MTEKISPQEIISRYENMKDIWPKSDLWHFYTGKIIHNTVREWTLRLVKDEGIGILNVGSGGSDYGLITENIIHIDLCACNLPIGNSAVCSAEELPFGEEKFDVAICVGSVINYCDPFVVLNEINRTLKPGGKLILEFEKSDNIEFIFTKIFFANTALINTFYNNQAERIWVYRESYIRKILSTLGFSITKRKAVHTISSATLKILPNYIAAKLAFLDLIFSKIPIINMFSSNVIIECTKEGV